MTDETNNALFIRLYLDEDVFRNIAPALHARGFDAISVHELDHYGWSDAEHLTYAAAEGRALFTFNASDYITLSIWLKESFMPASLSPNSTRYVKHSVACSVCSTASPPTRCRINSGGYSLSFD